MRGFALSLLIFCAQAAGQEERARGLAEASAEAVDRNPELAVLLAREALAAADVEEARTALYAALLETCRCFVLSGHEGAVSCGDISPDGKSLATGSEDGTARLWTPAGQQTAALACGAPVTEVRFLGSAERVMVATEAALSLWDRAGQKLAEFPAVPHEVTAGGLLLLPEGQVRLVSADGKVLRELAAVRGGVGGGDIVFHVFTADGRVRWYDRTGKEKAIKPAAGTSRIAFAASGSLVATFGSANTVELWSPEGKKLGELTHGGPVEQVSISPTGDRIVSAADDGQYSFWTGSGKLKGRVPKQGQARFLDISSPCGICVALAGEDHVMVSYPTLYSGDEIVAKRVGGRVRRIDPNPTGHGIRVEDAEGRPSFLFWTTLEEVKVRNSLRGELTVSRWGNRGDWQAYGDDRGKVVLHHWGRVRPLGLRGHTDAVLDVCFSADDRLLLTTSRDGTARLWEIDSPDMPVFYHPRNGVSGLGYSTGTTIVTFDWDGAHFWHRDGRHIRSLALRDNLSAWAVGEGVAFAADGDTAARYFDTVSGKEVGQFRHDGSIDGMTRSLNKADRFATFSSEDHSARIWDTAAKRRALLKHPCGVIAAAFSPDGSLLTVGEDNQARIWSSSGGLRSEFQVPGQLTACMYSPKGDRFVTAHDEARTLRVWTEKGKELGRLTGHVAEIHYMSFSFEGDALLTTSDDKTARVWDKDGRPERVVEHPSEVWAGGFLGGQQGFVTCCMDGTVRHWSRDGKLRAVMKGHTDNAVICVDCTDDGASFATGSADGTARIWPLKRDDLLRIAGERVARDFTPEERESFAELLAK